MTRLMSIGVGVILSLLTKSVKGASSLATILGLMLAFTAGIFFQTLCCHLGCKYYQGYSQ
ncbi:hypothetical protein [Staphylothermus hellenicus]|uniref:hypothetical protein n=1 Tax=Staphylothermus hellenicus TaxID=84599 RepID=UPI00164EE176|nr:hypothetical protein [Staphylothermus hellenicus]